jgi:GDPmannose 4,6-dehydratase
MFVVCGILFNHEGPRRGYNFVTQKIASHVGSLKRSLDKGFKTDTNMSNKKYILEMGNLNARRDWGSAKDYVEAMWMMLQQDSPKTFVVATGECHSVREFIEIAYAHIGITIVWKGQGSDEIGISKETGDTLVTVNPKFYRDIDIECLLGDATRIKEELGWTPKTSFKELVIEMVESGYPKNII